MSASDIAAWWGAIVATMVFGLDIFKWWKAGPKIIVRANPNMQMVSSGQGLEPEKNIFLEVVNNGDKLTTVTHVIIHHYKSKWSVICKKPNGQAVVPLPGPMQKLPFELEPGKRWTGLIDQSDIKSKFQGGYIYCGILHTATPKPILCKVVL